MQHDYNGFPNQRIARAVAAKYPENAKVIVHRDMDLLVPVFGTEGAHALVPNRSGGRIALPADEPVIRDVNTPWSIAKHAEARKPVTLGVVGADIREPFVMPLAEWTRHVLDMPIKFPGTDVRVPGALASVVPAIQRILDVEASLNPRYDEYYAYLSVHQADLDVGERMRENPYHVDGFQGPRWETKHPVNHSYLLSDALPTVFFPVGFPLDHIDPCFDDVYAEFERRIETGPKASPWRAKDFELVLMDAYCVHRGDVADRPMTRTWLRVSWETRIFDRLGNSHNPLFAYDWEMVPRDTDPRVRPRVPALAAVAA
jgi:hypothetical protein